MAFISRAVTLVPVHCRPLTRKKSGPELEVVDRSRPILATLDGNPIDDGVESRCSRYLDVRSTAEKGGACVDVAVGSVVGYSLIFRGLDSSNEEMETACQHGMNDNGKLC